MSEPGGQLATGLAAWLGIATAAAGLLSAATGEFGRTIRDHHAWATSGIGLLVSGLLVLWVAQWQQPRAAADIAHRLVAAGREATRVGGAAGDAIVEDAEQWAGEQRRRLGRRTDRLTLAGLGTSVLAVGTLVWLAVASSDDQARPQISAAVSAGEEGALELEATVQASGLRSENLLLTRAYGVSKTGAREPEVLFEANTGPDRDGSVDLTVRSPVASGRFDAIYISARIDGEPAGCVPPADDEAVLGDWAPPPGCLRLLLPGP